MIRQTVLDPNRAGKDAGDLEIGLRRQVVGQDEAIEQIAQVYQIHRTGLSPEGRSASSCTRSPI
jgi:ATP-dependent Clp protease ATP-binding subunit ClpA